MSKWETMAWALEAPDYRRIVDEAMGAGAQQVPEELAFLLPWGVGRTVVEIGSFNGGTLYAWSKVAERVISVDLEQPPELYGAEFVQGDSHDRGTYAKVAALLGSDGAGLVFIDAWHGYSAVKADWELWGDLAPYVAFHDVDLRCHIETGEEYGLEDAGVWKLWEEIEDRALARLVVHPGWCGVGIVRGL